MTEILSTVARLLRLILDAIERSQRLERVASHDENYRQIEADPVGWFCRHFGVSMPAVPADAGSPGATDTRNIDSITITKQSVERLSKYILDLERGYGS